MQNQIRNKVIITGDRPTGHLHLGHYVGTLQNRVLLQEHNTQYIMVANLQALTDNIDNFNSVSSAVVEIVKDYIAVGIDPEKSIIFLQSEISALAQMNVLFLNCVKFSRLVRNPTLKQEIKTKYGNSTSANMGFICYPVSQAADITAFEAQIVPVGQDQLPLIEQCNEIVKKINKLCKAQCLQKAQAMLSCTPKLVGIDGKAKMSKSLNNAIFLSDSDELIRKKVFSMFTDASRKSPDDPGNVQNNVVFKYLDVFFHNSQELQHLKQQYTKGGIKDTWVKELLCHTLCKLIEPIRQKRAQVTKKQVISILHKGNEIARNVSQKTLDKIKHHLIPM